MEDEMDVPPTLRTLMRSHRIDASALLRMHRAYMNTTQAQEAERVGVDQSTYSYYERGQNTPAIQHAARMEDLYGIPAAHWARRHYGS